MPPKYQVAIVGCGIAGATAAFLLAESGHEVELFEQAPRCGPVGAGVLLQPSGQAVLAQLGLLDEIARQSALIREIHAVTSAGSQLVRLPYAELDGQTYGLGVQRGVLFQSLYRRCPAASVAIREGHQITRRIVSQHKVYVEDCRGLRHGPFDFVLAADGSRSALRATSDLPHRCRAYRHAALWYVGTNHQITEKLFQVVRGTTVLIGLLPTGDGRCSLFWGEREDGIDALRERGLDAWKQRLIQLCPQAQETVTTIRHVDEMTFTTYRHVSMRRWFDQHTLFLGDAAHAMSPHLGQGVNLALIDAWTFAQALHESASFGQACQRFHHRRQRVVRFYSQLTRLLTPFFQSDSAILGWGRDMFLPWMPCIPWLRRQMLLTMAGLKQNWW